TRSYGDWSSDVCSSDLCRWRVQLDGAAQNGEFWALRSLQSEGWSPRDPAEVQWSPHRIRATWPRSPRSGDQDELSADVAALADRSEERRVGKEGGSRG